MKLLKMAWLFMALFLCASKVSYANGYYSDYYMDLIILENHADGELYARHTSYYSSGIPVDWEGSRNYSNSEPLIINQIKEISYTKNSTSAIAGGIVRHTGMDSGQYAPDYTDRSIGVYTKINNPSANGDFAVSARVGAFHTIGLYCLFYEPQNIPNLIYSPGFRFIYNIDGYLSSTPQSFANIYFNSYILNTFGENISSTTYDAWSFDKGPNINDSIWTNKLMYGMKKGDIQDDGQIYSSELYVGYTLVSSVYSDEGSAESIFLNTIRLAGVEVFYDGESPNAEFKFTLDDGDSIPVKYTRNSPVPLPSTLLLFGSGLAAMIGFGRKRKRE